MSAITVGGDLVHYEKLGRGRPVILIHGWVGSWRYWIPLMQHLHLKYSVYTLDLPGFGDSAKNPAKYPIARMVETLNQFMEQLAITKAAFIGHGLGALVLSEYAMVNPDRVARMLLISMPLFDPGDLTDRVPAGMREALTSNEPRTVPSAMRYDAPTIPSASNGGNDATADTETAIDATIARRPTPAFHEAETIIRPEAGLIDREKLAERAREVASSGKPNHLMDAFVGKSPVALLEKTYKKSDPIYDKLKVDVDKTDGRVLESSATGYEAGRMLDNLRVLTSTSPTTQPIPMCIVHGTDDPILPIPTDEIWQYLTVDRENALLPIAIPSVRHFPMLEYEPFARLSTDFLEAPELNKLEIRERWKRRSR
jgi:pimeloyl-ACP methyl ester carboxylesterase